MFGSEELLTHEPNDPKNRMCHKSDYYCNSDGSGLMVFLNQGQVFVKLKIDGRTGSIPFARFQIRVSTELLVDSIRAKCPGKG